MTLNTTKAGHLHHGAYSRSRNKLTGRKVLNSRDAMRSTVGANVNNNQRENQLRGYWGFGAIILLFY